MLRHFACTSGLFVAASIVTGCADDTVNDPFGSGGDTTSGGSGSSTQGPIPSDDTTSTGADESSPDSSSDTAAVIDDSTTAGPGSDSTSSTGEPSTDSSSSTGEPMESSSSSDGEEGSSTTGNNFTMCPVDVVTAMPAQYIDSTLGEGDEFGGSCGGGGAPEHAYVVTAPIGGVYVFDTFGSSMDTVLYVLDGECGGAELACDDDTQGNDSEVSVQLDPGESVTVVVDSFALEGGSYVLNMTSFAGMCPDLDMGNTVPNTVTGETVSGDNTTDADCGGGIANDISYTFTAPMDGVYVFDTAGSDFDTVLYARDTDCNGAEIGCNDNVGGGDDTSRIYAEMQSGDTVVVVVDGSGVASGNYVLNVNPHECPVDDLGTTIPQTATGSTAGAPAVLDASCSGGSGPEVGLLFTAAVGGTYVFDTVGSTFDTQLAVLDGPGCAGAELGCNDDAIGLQSQVVVDLAAGQQVSVIVDGFGAGSFGDYTLNITGITGTCPDEDLGNTVPNTVTGDTTTADNAGGASCGGLSGNDVNYTFTAPTDGLFIFDTFGSVADTVLYALADNCDGAELACSDDAVGNASTVSLAMTANQQVVIAVDTFGAGGPYTLNVSEYSCPTEDMGSTVPNGVSGSTAGMPAALDASCAGGVGPEVGWLFTAPADGAYTFNTFGTGFDTQLSVLDGAVCGGAELACNDDTGGLQSQVTVNLVMDQQVSVIVDGFGAGSFGNYVLNVQ